VDPANALWIGGPPGSGTSSVAQALAERFGLQLYAVDDQADAHEPRMPRLELASFVSTARHRFRLVLEDLRELPDDQPVIVEGPQLFPTNVVAVLRSPERALFLLPAVPGDVVAQTYERETRELRLPVVRVDGALVDVIELAAERLSAAAGTSR
jgi:hypothetical protein